MVSIFVAHPSNFLQRLSPPLFAMVATSCILIVHAATGGGGHTLCCDDLVACVSMHYIAHRQMNGAEAY